MDNNNFEEKVLTFIAGTNKGLHVANVGYDNVSLHPIRICASNAVLADDVTYHIYKGCTISLSTKMGNIVKVEFVKNEDTGTGDNLKSLHASCGSYSCSEVQKGIWTGEQKNIVFVSSDDVSFEKIVVTLQVPVAKAYSFLDSATEITLEDYDNANVTINRSFEADGGWWTLCLPFALDADQVKIYFGDGTELRTFESMNGTIMNFKGVKEMGVGIPYLIKPTKNFNGTTTAFEGVQLRSYGPLTPKRDGYAMCGTYNTVKLRTDGTDLFLGANNKLFKPTTSGNSMKGFRVYFSCPADKTGATVTPDIK